jgi:glutathione S-transferase
MGKGRPTLWQLEISHYSEKVRWALDHKRVPHGRRSPLPGAHIGAALALTGCHSYTLPVLELDGRAIADSTAIIAALEDGFPNRPLYPADPEQRRRALELEDFFDEELGPHVRRVVFHDLIGEPAVFDEVAAHAVPGRLGEAERIVGAYARRYAALRFGAADEGAAILARERVRTAMARLDLELEVNGGTHLVGDSFSVADLAAASMFYPLVGPEGGPLPADQPVPASLQELRDELAECPGYRWVEDTYRRHRAAASSMS